MTKRWLAVLLLLAALPAGASTFLAMSQGQLVAESDAVVRGKVLQVQSFWTKSGRLIATEAMVQVRETFAGKAPSVVMVRTFGGEVGGYRVEAHGFPKFKLGEDLVLYLANAQGTAEVAGYRQGQWRVVRDAKGVEWAVPTVEREVRLLTTSGAAAPRQQAVRLDALRNRIQAEAARLGRAN